MLPRDSIVRAQSEPSKRCPRESRAGRRPARWEPRRRLSRRCSSARLCERVDGTLGADDQRGKEVRRVEHPGAGRLHDLIALVAKLALADRPAYSHPGELCAPGPRRRLRRGRCDGSPEASHMPGRRDRPPQTPCLRAGLFMRNRVGPPTRGLLLQLRPSARNHGRSARRRGSPATLPPR